MMNDNDVAQMTKIKIIDASGKMINILPIADFYQSVEFGLSNTQVVKPSIHKAFRVSFEDMSLKDKESIEVNMEVTNPDDPTKPLESTTITLYKDNANPGRFVSLELLPVASSKVDSIPLSSFPDNSVQDQSFYVKLGSEVKVSLSVTEPGSEKPSLYTASARVPINKVAVVRPKIALDEVGNPLSTEEQVNKQLSELREALAVDGIYLMVEPITMIKSESISLKDGLNNEEAKQFAQTFSSPGKPVIHLVFAGETFNDTDKKAFRVAKVDEIGRKDDDPAYFNIVFVKNSALAYDCKYLLDVIRSEDGFINKMNGKSTIFQEPAVALAGSKLTQILAPKSTVPVLQSVNVRPRP